MCAVILREDIIHEVLEVMDHNDELAKGGSEADSAQLADTVKLCIQRQYAKLTPGRVQAVRSSLQQLHSKNHGQLDIATGNTGTELIMLFIHESVS